MWFTGDFLSEYFSLFPPHYQIDKWGRGLAKNLRRINFVIRRHTYEKTKLASESIS